MIKRSNFLGILIWVYSNRNTAKELVGQKMPKISCIGNCVFQMRIKSAYSIHLDNDNVSSLSMIETTRCKGRSKSDQ